MLIAPFELRTSNIPEKFGSLDAERSGSIHGSTMDK